MSGKLRRAVICSGHAVDETETGVCGTAACGSIVCTGGSVTGATAAGADSMAGFWAMTTLGVCGGAMYRSLLTGGSESYVLGFGRSVGAGRAGAAGIGRGGAAGVAGAAGVVAAAVQGLQVLQWSHDFLCWVLWQPTVRAAESRAAAPTKRRGRGMENMASFLSDFFDPSWTERIKSGQYLLPLSDRASGGIVRCGGRDVNE
jgi:hypothetical protein